MDSRNLTIQYQTLLSRQKFTILHKKWNSSKKPSWPTFVTRLMLSPQVPSNWCAVSLLPGEGCCCFLNHHLSFFRQFQERYAALLLELIAHIRTTNASQGLSYLRMFASKMLYTFPDPLVQVLSGLSVLSDDKVTEVYEKLSHASDSMSSKLFMIALMPPRHDIPPFLEVRFLRNCSFSYHVGCKHSAIELFRDDEVENERKSIIYLRICPWRFSLWRSFIARSQFFVRQP